jgi:hypothetical protein
LRRYLHRGVEDTKQNELLSAASDWMSDQCDAEDEQSEAFEAAVICGMGWTEARMSYDEMPEGKYVEVEADPFEMCWDCKASKKNLFDARRIYRVRNFCISEARAMFPGVPDEDLDAAWADQASPAENQVNPRPVEDRATELSTRDCRDPGKVALTRVICPMSGVDPESRHPRAPYCRRQRPWLWKPASSGMNLCRHHSTRAE